MVNDTFLQDWKLTNHTITMTHYDMIKNGELQLPSHFSDTTMDTISHVIDSITKAENGSSKIDPVSEGGKALLSFEGYTGTKTRHFYNNICSRPHTKYMEIGTWNGSSSISAVYKNNIDGLFIDNWSQFGGSSQVFKDNISKFGGSSKCYLLEGDCWEVDLSTLDRYNVYLYDGDHAEADHFKALQYYLPVLTDEFIFLVDDYNWSNVRDGTMRAINELNLNVKFRHEIFMSPDDLVGMPNHVGKKTWWNGIGIFVLSKTRVTLHKSC